MPNICTDSPATRYIHLFWPPSVSPDVADGGGYRLYINNQPALNLGPVLDYRLDGFENGVTYICRLTAVDKYGNESAGKTVTLIPSGAVLQPTPTPTPLILITPTPTRPLTSTPSPTPITGNTPAPTVTPSPTPTQPYVGIFDWREH